MRNFGRWMMLLASVSALFATEVTNQPFYLGTGDSVLISFYLRDFMNEIQGIDPSGRFPRQIGIQFTSSAPSGPQPPLFDPYPGYSFQLQWLLADTLAVVGTSTPFDLVHSTIQSGPALADVGTASSSITVAQSLADASLIPYCCPPGQTTGILRLTNLGLGYLFEKLVLNQGGTAYEPGGTNPINVLLWSDVTLLGSPTQIQGTATIVKMETVTSGVPEPGTLGLGLAALSALVWAHRRRVNARNTA